MKCIANYPLHGKVMAFEVHRIKEKIPCIIGNAKEKMSSSDMLFIAVIRPTDGRTVIHPLPVRDLCFYEVHIGDYISVFEVVDDVLYINGYMITEITDTHVIAIHATI